MKKDWEIKKLGDICDFFAGYTPKQNELSDLGDIPYFKVSDMNRDGNELFMSETELYAVSPKKIIPKDSIVFPKNGGAVFTNKKRILSQDSVIDLNSEGLFHKDYIDVMFLYYFLQLIDLKDYSKGAALPTIDMTALKNVSINVPPLEEQKRIVKILDEKFAQLESLKTNAQINLQNTKDLFQSQLAKAFSNTTWEKKTIGDICILKSGNSSSNNSKPGNLPYVKVGDMTINGNEKTITTSTLFVDYEENKKNIFPKGTVIFPKRGGAILTNKKRLTAVEICCDLNIMGVIPTDKILSEFLYYYFIGIDFAELCNGAAIPQINNIDINPLTISLPPLPEQKRIVKELDTLSEKVRQLQEIYTKQIANCEELKQSLLQKAFEGEF